MSVKTKKCSKCKHQKSREHFYKSSASKDGLQGYCKKCAASTNKKNRKRKKFLEQDGKSLEAKAGFINKLHTRRANQTETDIDVVFLLNLLLDTTSCPMCGRKYTRRGPGQKNLDHIIPISEGGSHSRDNVRIICRTCNLSRNRKDSSG